MIIILLTLIIVIQIYLSFRYFLNKKDIIFVYVISYFLALTSLPIYLLINEEHSNSTYMILSMILHAPLFILGFLITSKFLFKENNNYAFKGTVKLEKNIFNIFSILLVFSFALQVSNGIGSLPLFIFMTASDVGGDFAAVRSEYFNENGLLGLFFHYSRAIVAPILICLIIGRLKVEKSKLFYCFFLLIIILHNALTTALAPVANLAFASFIYIYLANKKLKLGKLTAAFFLILTFPIFIESLVSADSFLQSTQHTVLKIFDRFSYDQVDRINTYFEIFGSSHDHMGGVGNKVYRLITGSYSEQSIANIAFLGHMDDYKSYYKFGNLNANFLAFHYADFGFYISLILNVMWGAIFGVFQAPLSTVKQTNFVKAILTVAMLSSWRLMGTQPTTVLFSGGVVFLIFVYILRKRV